MNNINRVQNLIVSDGTAFPANNAAITSVTSGKIGIYGADWTALNPAGGDTISTQPSIYAVEGKTTTSGVFYLKKSAKINGTNVTSYTGASYAPDQRNVWTIGYDRKAATGTINAVSSTEYRFSIRFKNDKWMYSERPELFTFSVVSSDSATQSSIATQIASKINNQPGVKDSVSAIVVGNGTGVYGVTGATQFGVEITGKDVNQYSNSTYTLNLVYFSVAVDDSTGFGTTTTCTETQAMKYGVGTFNQVRNLEKKCMAYEGGNINLRQWPIPELDYSSTSSYILSAAIAETVAGTTGEDKVTFSATVAAKIRAGEKVELDGVNYEIKYFISSTVAILTSTLTTSPTTGAVKLRYKYDMFNIEFTDSVNTPTGTIAVATKSVVIASPAIDAGGAYNSIGAATQDILDVLNAWMITTPGAFANVSV